MLILKGCLNLQSRIYKLYSIEIKSLILYYIDTVIFIDDYTIIHIITYNISNKTTTIEVIEINI